MITRSEESYILWCVVVWVLETLWVRGSWSAGGCRAKNGGKKINSERIYVFLQGYIYGRHDKTHLEIIDIWIRTFGIYVQLCLAGFPCAINHEVTNVFSLAFFFFSDNVCSCTQSSTWFPAIKFMGIQTITLNFSIPSITEIWHVTA